ncbi:MAG: biotin/lipoate A/B protein ligase family protein [Candidatus Ozemobacteraceae bacterium]
MVEAWRLIYEDSDDPAFHLASLEALWRSLDEGPAPDTIVLRRLSPCVLIGSSQDADEEVDLHECRKRGIPVLRRPSEGGAIYCDRDCLVFSCLCRRCGTSFGNQSELLLFWGRVVVKALQRLGVTSDACFIRPNDVTINGKKVAGLTITDWYGIRAFSGALLIDCDIVSMSAVLTPGLEKLKRHGADDLAGRLASLRQTLHSPLSHKIVAEALLASISSECSKPVIRGNLTNQELELTNELQKEKYGNPRWNQCCGSPAEALIPPATAATVTVAEGCPANHTTEGEG